MKKLIAVILVLVMVLSLAACAGTKDPVVDQPQNNVPENNQPEQNDPVEDENKAMTYAEYMAAPLDSEVTVECYVQGNQSWWDNKVTVYAADADGAYFIYELACSEEDAAKLLPGTKIRVSGYKGEWEGEVEIMEGTFEFAGSDTYIAEAKDLTDLLGTEELINYQNQLASFKGLTVESITYKNEGGDDIWLTLSKDGKEYSFTVEVYLTGPDSDVYTTVGTLEVGNVVNVEGFLYWYQGSDVHVTSIELAA
jgi:predicted small lipoprotein YifL